MDAATAYCEGAMMINIGRDAANINTIIHPVCWNVLRAMKPSRAELKTDGLVFADKTSEGYPSSSTLVGCSAHCRRPPTHPTLRSPRRRASSSRRHVPRKPRIQSSNWLSKHRRHSVVIGRGGWCRGRINDRESGDCRLAIRAPNIIDASKGKGRRFGLEVKRPLHLRPGLLPLVPNRFRHQAAPLLEGPRDKSARSERRPILR